ncbi:MAG: bile acid:sodium symporter family protein [Phaeodactylibacter sp.]|nr:bile acid:sodium symporter family protein [Phaeodactylibacter sp.]MCB9266174.1 bile acid:sodium symporter family protein [Lewinellaceae bacterium]MCB9287825.1 bile acid:sodium symporter family protein [Lewinellaceae bacterium]
MQAIDSVHINFNPEQLFILNICLAFLMFGVALDLRFDNFQALARSPKAPLVGLSSQLVLLPLLTLALIFFFRPAPSIALGMVLVAACPGGNVSNFAVHLANANAALSVLMTSISTLAAIVITPVYFTYLAPLVPGVETLQHPIYVDPLDMVSTIVQLILIPLFIGMFLNYRFPAFSAHLKRPVRILSLAIFLGFIVAAVYGNFDNIVKYLHVVFLLVLVHNASALLTGYWWAKSNGLSRQDARAISIETGIQNSGLGLILIFNFFNGLGGMAMIAAWWGVWHLVSAFSLALLWRERSVLSVE